MPSIGEFFVSLFVDSSAGQVSVRDLISKFGDLEAATLAEGAGLVALAAGLGMVADKAMDVAVAFQRFESTTGLSSQELQKWQIVAMQANVSAETISSSVSGLQMNLAKIRIGQGNISPFLMLGVTDMRDAFSVLEQLRSRIKYVNPAMAANLLQQAGISPDMLRVLQLSNVEFARFIQTARGMSTVQAQGFLQMRQELVQIGLELRDVGYAAASTLKPFIDDLFMCVQGVHNLHASMPVLAATFAIILTMISPITAAIVGLLLVLDDLAAYSQGRKSLFGIIEEKLLGEGQGDTLKFWKEHLGKAGEYFGNIAEHSGGTYATEQATTDYVRSKGGTVQHNKVDIHIHESHNPKATGKEAHDRFVDETDMLMNN